MGFRKKSGKLSAPNPGKAPGLAMSKRRDADLRFSHPSTSDLDSATFCKS
jgi:hypothetical protein